MQQTISYIIVEQIVQCMILERSVRYREPETRNSKSRYFLGLDGLGGQGGQGGRNGIDFWHGRKVGRVGIRGSREPKTHIFATGNTSVFWSCRPQISSVTQASAKLKPGVNIENTASSVPPQTFLCQAGPLIGLDRFNLPKVSPGKTSFHQVGFSLNIEIIANAVPSLFIQGSQCKC